MLPEICPTVDTDIAAILRKELAEKNITFHTGAQVEEITEQEVKFKQGDDSGTAPADLVLVATGRTPNVEGLGLKTIGVEFDRHGIRIDDRCATNIPGIWAAGDVTGRTWLAHAASRMGEVVVNNITDRKDRVRFDTIAGVIYTNPEVATVGLTEAQAAEQNIPIKKGKFPMAANGRFLAEHADGSGVTKVIVHADSGVVLGVHMIGGVCSEMIFGAAIMIETECRVSEIEDIVFPHPTTSEMIRDTLLTI
jgi:dihydrolipoamide dehydrogenase